jgi:NAD(P)-dependent dehydrogenase (short-subunit alcohol dehydrogenase family)
LVESIERAIDCCEKDLGPVDILINNAGTNIYRNAMDYQPEEFDEVMDTNTRGAFLVASEVARRMVRRGVGGKIINIASVAAFRAFKQLTVYGMSKAALLQMTRGMALELASYRIEVNAIAPGYILTPMNESVWPTTIGQRIIETLPRRRVGRPEDLDGALLLLAGSHSQFITGSVITVDDGLTA